MQIFSQIITNNKPTSWFLQAGCPSCRDVIKTRESETKTRQAETETETKTREAETKTKTKTSRVETKTSKSGLDRSRDQDQVSRYVHNVDV